MKGRRVGPRDWMLALGVPDGCIEEGKRAAEERGRSFLLHVPKGARAFRTKVDGCWFTGNTPKRVDFLFCVELPDGSWAVLLVELKGGHFKEALEQIDSTFRQLRSAPAGAPVARREAHVIMSHGRQIPRYDVLRVKIEREHKAIVYPHSGRYEARLDR